MFHGYIVVVNPKLFTSSNCSTFVKTYNCMVFPTSKGQHTQLHTSHPVHSLTLNSNVRGTKSTVIGPSHEFFHNFFSRSQAHKLTLPGSPNSNLAVYTPMLWPCTPLMACTVHAGDMEGPFWWDLLVAVAKQRKLRLGGESLTRIQHLCMLVLVKESDLKFGNQNSGLCGRTAYLGEIALFNHLVGIFR